MRERERERAIYKAESVLNATYHAYVLKLCGAHTHIGRSAEKVLIGIQHNCMEILRFFIPLRPLLALYRTQIAVAPRLFFFIRNCRKILISHFCAARDREAFGLSAHSRNHQLLFRRFFPAHCNWKEEIKKNTRFDSHTFCTLLRRETNFPFYCPVSLKCFFLSSSASAASSFIIPKYRCFVLFFFFSTSNYG